MKLIYQSFSRVESDAAIIANLKRKGWVETADDPPPAPEELTPSEVQNWQLEEELAERGLLAGLKAAIQSLPDGPTRQKAEARFAKKPTIRRTDPLVSALGVALGKKPADIDQIFTSASVRV